MKLITATVKSNPREVNTKYGQRCVMDCLANGNGSRAPEIKDYIQRHTKLLSYCIKQVQEELGDLDPTTEQKYATTLYLQTVRNFKL